MPNVSANQGFLLYNQNEQEWHLGVQQAMAITNRGVHFSAVAGMNINTGYAVDIAGLGSGYARHANAGDALNEAARFRPIGVARHSASSGQFVSILVHGVIRSLSIMSAAYAHIGRPVVVSPLTPGLVISSWAAAPIIGISIPNGIFVTPNMIPTSGYLA